MAQKKHTRKKTTAKKMIGKTANKKAVKKKIKIDKTTVHLPKALASTVASISRQKNNSKEKCERLHGAVDAYLERRREPKPYTFDPCTSEGAGCGCNGASGGKAVVDLVVLIDTSGSMSTKGEAISEAADFAISEALKNCPTDLRVTWLGLGQPFPNTKFTQAYQPYLTGLNRSPAPSFTGSGHPEEGADAVADVSQFFDWRLNACRAVFYLSDEPLDNGAPQNTGDDSATANAITVAKANNTTVFTHLVGGTGFSSNTSTIENFTDIAVQTGGNVVVGGLGSKSQYEKMLQDIICNACGGCKTVEWPDIHPCISVKWGDSTCDKLETDDLEILSLSVSNCYDNVTFKEFEIAYLWVTDNEGKAVPVLPDGTPSVQVIPIGPICFGDIMPCKAGEATSVTREFVLRNRGAKAGMYKLEIGGVCYKTERQVLEHACFEFELCAS